MISFLRLKRVAFTFGIAVLAAAAMAAGSPRTQKVLYSGWRFHLGDVAGGQQPDLDDSTWSNVVVPHDWSIQGDYNRTNATGSRCGYLPSGIGWYRRIIEVPADWKGKTVTLEFEGVYMDSTVWLNGERVGGRPYGYSTFTCDLTSHLKPGRNELAVRVDDSLEPSARWYHGCGIYGQVRLFIKNPIHVPFSGIFVRTPSIKSDVATVDATAEVTNGTATPATVEVQFKIIGPDGRSIAVASTQSVVNGGVIGLLQQDLTVKHPRLWSVSTPTLYTLQTHVLHDGRLVDEVSTPFGIRSIRFDANQGFFLNGHHMKLKGVCEHEGGSPFGAAIPAALLERRLRQLKAMGCNAIRTAHNPELPEFYDLCDRMGFLVMDEVFDGWHRKAKYDYGGRFFKEWWRRDVTDWVKRDRNHPCVILWSIGNETGRDDVNHITQFIHRLDDTRPTTGGSVIHGVDVAGFNGGILRNNQTLENFHRHHPNQPIVLTEEPHTYQTRGFYRTVNHILNPFDQLPDYAYPGVFSGGSPAYYSSYDNYGKRFVARTSWKRTVSRSWVGGEFRWTGFDYLGEANGKFARESSQGVLDLAGFPKDEYYFYQSVWTDKPMVHLLPDWTLPGYEGKIIPVVAYANADAVELFQDGKSLGRKRRSTLFEFVWHVPYHPGVLKAIAYRNGKAVAETTDRTAGAPVKLKLTTDNDHLRADHRDLALVTVAVCDAQGTLVPDADNWVDLACTGPARWLGGENGDPVDFTPQRATCRKVFAGLSRGFYGGEDGKTGPVLVSALGILGATTFDRSTRVTIDLERVALRGQLPGRLPEIHYTTDGSVPTSGSPVYTGPFTLTATTTVRAAAFSGDRRILLTRAVFIKNDVAKSHLNGRSD